MNFFLHIYIYQSTQTHLDKKEPNLTGIFLLMVYNYYYYQIVFSYYKRKPILYAFSLINT